MILDFTVLSPLGALLCGIAPTYPLLLGARIVTGLFGRVSNPVAAGSTAGCAFSSVSV